MAPKERTLPEDPSRWPHYITLRLPDALPRAIMEAWHDDVDRRIHILSDMKGRALQPEEERTLIQRTIGRIERFLDSGRGTCLLSDERAAGLVESVLWAGDHDRYHLHAWCVMPNHVHVLVTPFPKVKLEEILQEWKTESTRWVNQELRRSGALWHPDVIDHPIGHPADFTRLCSAVSENALRAGFHDWPFAGQESRKVSPVTAA